jgi:predicted dehydrogenase
MTTHDFDAARWLVDEVQTARAVATARSTAELLAGPDVDTGP